MRILHVTKKFPPVVGGDATAVSSLAQVQSRNGHDVHVLTYRAEGIQETDHVHPVGPMQTLDGLDRIGARRLRGMRAIRVWSREHLAALGIELVHAHAVDVGSAVVRTAKRERIPILLTCHGVWFPYRPRGSLLGWVERSLLHQGYDAISSVDSASVQAIRRAGIPRASLVPNGVDASEFHTPGLAQNPVRFLFVGRHVYQKGIDVLLEATALVRSRLPEPFVLELAGDGPQRQALERRAHSLGLADTVRFLGSLSRPDLIEAYGRATVFVLPSRFEGFPLALLEAWAAGLPVIASKVGGIPDLCNEGNAILVPAGQVEPLADSMISLLRDPIRSQSLGAAGCDLVRTQYTWDAIASSYERLYAECVRPKT